MKRNFSRSSVLLLMFFVFGVVVSVFIPNSSQAIPDNNSSQISKLMDKLDQLTEAILELGGTNKNQKADDSIGLLAEDAGIPNPACFDNYASWSQSATFNSNAPWSTSLFSSGPNGSSQNKIQNLMTDLNGDGLVDYLHIDSKYKYDYNGLKYNQGYECVLLNNGNGWSIAYRCITQTKDNKPYYYGDCALVN